MSTAVNVSPLPSIIEKEPISCKEGVERLSESIDTNVLFLIKGHPGFYTARTKPNKSNLVKLVRFMDDETHWVKVKTLQRLSGSLIYKADNTAITIEKAFDNLQEYFDNRPAPSIYLEQPAGIMHFICPGHDREQFKSYHAVRIIRWYNEIVNAINK